MHEHWLLLLFPCQLQKRVSKKRGSFVKESFQETELFPENDFKTQNIKQFSHSSTYPLHIKEHMLLAWVKCCSKSCFAGNSDLF